MMLKLEMRFARMDLELVLDLQCHLILMVSAWVVLSSVCHCWQSGLFLCIEISDRK